MIRRGGEPVVGFGEDANSLKIPPLELRTAYTIKGLGIGGGGLIGYLVGGPLGMVGLGFAGWMLGNHVAIVAEKKYSNE